MTKVAPGRKIRRRRHTRRGRAWTQSSCRRSTGGTCTCGGRTTGRGRVTGARGRQTWPERSHWPARLAYLPDHWYPRLCEPLYIPHTSTVRRLKAVYSSWWKPISELRSVTCHMGSHSATSHPTQVNAPRLHPSQNSNYLHQRAGRLSWPWWLDIYQDGLPVHRQSPIQVETTW